MYHPSIYVLVTDLDDMEEMEAAASQKGTMGNSSSTEAAALAALSTSSSTAAANDIRKPLLQNSSNKILTSPAINGVGGGGGLLKPSSLSHIIKRSKIDHATAKMQPYYDTQTQNFTCNTTNTHAPPQAACEMPERAWQDCVTNALHVQHYFTDVTDGASSAASMAMDQTDSNNANMDAAAMETKTTILSQKQQQQQIWGFVDPSQKAPCICTK